MTFLLGDERAGGIQTEIAGDHTQRIGKEIEAQARRQTENRGKGRPAYYHTLVVIPRDQMWFYTKEWQADEQKVEQQIQEGKIKTARNKEELFKDLGLDEL